jgi:hypothetical protein
VPYAVNVNNPTTHTDTGCTPFKLVYGLKSEVPSALRDSPSLQHNYEDYLMELKGRLQTAHEEAWQNLILCKEKIKKQYDKGTEPLKLDAGQQVLLYDETVRRSRSKKLSPQYIGPYEALFVNGINTMIKKGQYTLQVNVNMISHIVLTVKARA